MGKESKIQWTDATWNVAIGCDKVSAGCKNCYMMRDWNPETSMKGKGREIPVNGVVTRTKPATFNAPLKWQKQGLRSANGGRLKVFTSSLTDVFHPAIDDYRNEVWDIIKKCPDLIFQILTKRPERIEDHLPEDWGDGWENVWLGVSIENQEVFYERLQNFYFVNAVCKFISFEPLIGPVSVNELITVSSPDEDTGEPMRFTIPAMSKINWAIIGGESGNKTGKYKFRECSLKWIEDLVKKCKKHKTPVFVKQLGTYLAKEFKKMDVDIGRSGGGIKNLPDTLQYLNIREFPNHYLESEQYSCMNCGKDYWTTQKTVMCCSGLMCGCMGMPIEPMCCSKKCEDEIML